MLKIKNFFLFCVVIFNFLLSGNNENLNDFIENVAKPIQKNCNINLIGLINDIEEFKKKSGLSLNSLINSDNNLNEYSGFLMATIVNNILLPGFLDYNYCSDSNNLDKKYDFLNNITNTNLKNTLSAEGYFNTINDFYLNDFTLKQMILNKIFLNQKSDFKDHAINNLKKFFEFCKNNQENKVGILNEDEFILTFSDTKEGQKTVYSSDLHSSVLNFKKIILENFSTNKNSKINYIFTGDYVDRGANDIINMCGSLINIIISSALNCSEKKSNFIFLKGNHENLELLENYNPYLFKLFNNISLFTEKKDFFEKLYPIANFNIFQNEKNEKKLIIQSHHGQMLDDFEEKINLNEIKNNISKIKIKKNNNKVIYAFWADFLRSNENKIIVDKNSGRPAIPFNVLKEKICDNLVEIPKNCLNFTINGHTHNENVNKLFEKLINDFVCLIKKEHKHCHKNYAPGCFDKDYIKSKEFYNYIKNNEKDFIGLFLPCSCGLNLFGQNLKHKNVKLIRYFNKNFNLVSGTLGYEIQIINGEVIVSVIDLENNKIISQLNEN